MELIEITSANVEKLGYFCRMSKMKTPGNQNKVEWLKKRFSEGLKIKMFRKPERGFIEYIPGEYAWRSIRAKGYMVIHCLWVVGKSKGKDLGSILIGECISDAKKAGMNGVAVVTSEGTWMTGRKFFQKHGFETVDRSPESFELLLHEFKTVTKPTFTGNWVDKCKKFGDGLTILKTPQCPYNEDAQDTIIEVANELGISSRVIDLTSAEEVRNLSPSPYGTFNVVVDGRFFSYEYSVPKLLKKKLIEFRKGN